MRRRDGRVAGATSPKERQRGQKSDEAKKACSLREDMVDRLQALEATAMGFPTRKKGVNLALMRELAARCGLDATTVVEAFKGGFPAVGEVTAEGTFPEAKTPEPICVCELLQGGAPEMASGG